MIRVRFALSSDCVIRRRTGNASRGGESSTKNAQLRRKFRGWLIAAGVGDEGTVDVSSLSVTVAMAKWTAQTDRQSENISGSPQRLGNPRMAQDHKDHNACVLRLPNAQTCKDEACTVMATLTRIVHTDDI